jgi:hypothetical protein
MKKYGETVEKLEHEDSMKQLKESVKETPTKNSQTPNAPKMVIEEEKQTRQCQVAKIKNEGPGKNNPVKLPLDSGKNLPVDDEIFMNLSDKRYLIMKSRLKEHCQMADYLKMNINMIATIQEIRGNETKMKINLFKQKSRGFFLIPLKDMEKYPLNNTMNEKGYIDRRNDKQYKIDKNDNRNIIESDQKNKLEADMPVILLKTVFGHLGFLKPAERLLVDTTGSGMMLGPICSKMLITKDSYDYLPLKNDSILKKYFGKTMPNNE